MGDLEQLKQEATTLNIEFKEDVTYEELIQQVEAAKLELKKQDENNQDSKGATPNIVALFTENKEIVKTLKAEELEVLCKEFGIDYINVKDAKEKLLSLKFDESNQDSKDVLIKRVSKCGNYTAKIEGLEETARRSGVDVEALEKALETGELLNNFTFEIVK